VASESLIPSPPIDFSFDHLLLFYSVIKVEDLERSDFYHEEFADELARIISPPDYDCFYFKSKPDPGELTSIVDFGIRENVLSTANVNLPFEDDQSPLLAYVVWIFLLFLTINKDFVKRLRSTLEEEWINEDFVKRLRSTLEEEGVIFRIMLHGGYFESLEGWIGSVLIMCGDMVKDSNSYLKSRGSIEDFVSFREMITSQLQGKLWLYDEVLVAGEYSGCDVEDMERLIVGFNKIEFSIIIVYCYWRDSTAATESFAVESLIVSLEVQLSINTWRLCYAPMGWIRSYWGFLEGLVPRVVSISPGSEIDYYIDSHILNLYGGTLLKIDELSTRGQYGVMIIADEADLNVWVGRIGEMVRKGAEGNGQEDDRARADGY
ncbi:hypothetical protein Tco_0242865, partial [Tanacetum coccineum]